MQRKSRQERLNSHGLSCGDMDFDQNLFILYLNAAYAIQSIFGVDCGWAADYCKGWPSAPAFGG
jgi:hypothetical protein